MAKRTWREIVQQLLLKRQQDAAKPPAPEPSYFGLDAKKPDSKPDDKRPARASHGRPGGSVDSSRDRTAKPAPAKAGDAKRSFDEATDAKRIKEEDAFNRRFKTPQTRAAAMEVREDIQDAREEIEKKYRKDIEAATEVIRRIVNDPRPWPEDATRDANRKFADLAEARERQMIRLDRLQEEAFAQLSVMDVKLKNWGPNRLRIGTTYETDATRDFNEAAAPAVADTELPDLPVEDSVTHASPEAETALPEEPEPALPINWVEEFNSAARPDKDGPGIKP